ncbi:MAG: tape measure protein [Planctomycetota bacterium]
MAGLGDLVAVLTANTAPWSQGFAIADSTLGRFVSAASSKLSSIGSMVRAAMPSSSGGGFFSGLVGGLSSLGLVSNGIGAIKGALTGLSMPLTLAANAEKTEIAFTTMLKSAEKAKTLLGQLNSFAAATPFDQPGIVDAGRKLLAFGIDAKAIIPTLTALGDVAAGVDQPIGELAELFGKAKTQGTLMSEDINQLTGRGIPIIAALAKQFGVAESAIKDMASKGKINFSHLQKAFVTMTGKGGQFSGLMAAQSQSAGGLWSSLADNLGITFKEIGTSLIGGFNLKGLMTNSIGFLETFRSTWLPGISATIATIGTRFTDFTAGLVTSWGAWIMSSLSEIYAWGDTFQGAFSQFIQFAGDILGWWQGVFFAVASYFSNTWGDTFSEVTGMLSFMMRNWYTLLQIGVANVALFAVNSWAHVNAFFQNLVIWLKWLPGNWKSVMVTMADLLMTVFINMGKNIRGFFKSLWDFASGKGFKFETTALTDGFHNSIGQLPQLVEAAVSDSTPALDGMYDTLNHNEAEFAKKQAERIKAQTAAATAAPTPASAGSLADFLTKDTTAAKKPDGKKDKSENKAIEARSAEAFRLFRAAQGGPRSATDKIADNTAGTNKLLTQVLTQEQRQTTAIEKQKPPQVVAMRK